jgi:hypothetical protein
MGVLFFCLAFFWLVADRQAPPVYFFSNDCGSLRRVSGALSLAVDFNPRYARYFFHVASATIEFNRR